MEENQHILFPKRVTVEMTNNCNLNCPMCLRRFTNNKTKYMSFAMWKQIIDEVTDHNVILVPFWMGESLTHPAFEEMISYAIGKVEEIQFATNGILVFKYMKMLMQLDFISVSCHNAEGLLAVKDLYITRGNMKQAKPKIQMSFVESEESIKSLTLFSKYADIVRVYDEHSEDGNFGSSKNKIGKRTFCEKLTNDITIASDGSISRCCYNWLTDAPLSIKSSTISEAWNSNIYNAMRDDYPDMVCAKCDQWAGITSGITMQQI